MKRLKNLKMFILASSLLIGVHVFNATAMEKSNKSYQEIYEVDEKNNLRIKNELQTVKLNEKGNIDQIVKQKTKKNENIFEKKSEQKNFLTSSVTPYLKEEKNTSEYENPFIEKFFSTDEKINSQIQNEFQTVKLNEKSNIYQIFKQKTKKNENIFEKQPKQKNFLTSSVTPYLKEEKNIPEGKNPFDNEAIIRNEKPNNLFNLTFAELVDAGWDGMVKAVKKNRKKSYKGLSQKLNIKEEKNNVDPDFKTQIMDHITPGCDEKEYVEDIYTLLGKGLNEQNTSMLDLLITKYENNAESDNNK